MPVLQFLALRFRQHLDCLVTDSTWLTDIDNVRRRPYLVGEPFSLLKDISYYSQFLQILRKFQLTDDKTRQLFVSYTFPHDENS